MKSSEILEKFLAKMTQVYLYQRAMQDLTQGEIRKLREYAEALEANPSLPSIGRSYNNMFFRSPRSGELVHFGRDVSGAEERMAEIYAHRNKQYQWLLSESWEEFEDFLEEMYAYVGMKDHDFWPLQDFGAATLKDLEGKSYAWFRELAKKKKNAPTSILNQFRRRILKIQAIEKSNSLGVDLRLALAIVEKLRHIVVHKAGEVEDKKEFIDGVLSRAGISLSGAHRTEVEGFVNYFFGSGPHENTVALLELNTGPEVPLPTYINRFEDAVGYLIGYAHCLQEEVEAFFVPSAGPNVAELER